MAGMKLEIRTSRHPFEHFRPIFNAPNSAGHLLQCGRYRDVIRPGLSPAAASQQPTHGATELRLGAIKLSAKSGAAVAAALIPLEQVIATTAVSSELLAARANSRSNGSAFISTLYLLYAHSPASVLWRWTLACPWWCRAEADRPHTHAVLAAF